MFKNFPIFNIFIRNLSFMRYFFYSLFSLTVVVVFFGCSRTSQGLKPGTWRATLNIQGRELPFGLLIEKSDSGSSYKAFLQNGKEKFPFDRVIVKDDTVRFLMELFNSELRAVIRGEQLEGLWIRNGYMPEYKVPFHAEYGKPYRFFELPKSNDGLAKSFQGTWKTTFKDSTGHTTQAVGIFNGSDYDVVEGTFLTSSGDYRFLEGQVRSDSLFLSAFDGAHAFLFVAKLKKTEFLEGKFWSGRNGYETWSAEWNPTASLPDADTITSLKHGYETVDFSFPNLEGKSVSLQDDRFKNKPVIIQILGSWCPNCMDETAFLSKWYQENRNRGIEIVGLAYEKSPDFYEASERVKRMKKRFDIRYELLIAGTPEKASATLPMLNSIQAFPTTIFLDKSGKVRKIHTGFSGPGTGRYYEKFLREFRHTTNSLIGD